MVAVAGIDPSLSGFAVAVSAGTDVGDVHEWKTKAATGVPARVARYSTLVRNMAEACAGARLVAIEGYSFNSKQQGEHLGELGGILRCQLVHDGIDVIEVPPATLKKWATGKGNADKTLVATELAKRYGRTFASNNQSDAFALCVMAMQLSGIVEPATAFQRDVIAKLRAART